jgi:hypothetical protein
MSRFDWVAEFRRTWGTKPVILVEGEDDILFYKHLLRLVDPDWEDRFGIEWVCGKSYVFRGCKKVPSWRGIVDCDEWDDAKVALEQRKVPNVQILPRFMTQNYWVNPDELWTFLPAHQRRLHIQAQPLLNADIEAQRTDWVAHGAMWRVMLRRRTGLGELGFPSELMESPVTDENQIREILGRWHNHLEPADIIAEYRQERTNSLSLRVDEQYARVIHGKMFFKRVVVQSLNRALGQQKASVWAIDLIQGMNVPADLQPILRVLLS